MITWQVQVTTAKNPLNPLNSPVPPIGTTVSGDEENRGFMCLLIGKARETFVCQWGCLRINPERP